MTTLPSALRSAIQDLLQGTSRRALSVRAQAASEGYRAGTVSSALIRDEADVAAYLTVRMPATFAAVAAAIREIRIVLPDYAPRGLLDMACGPGTAAFACVEAWPSVEAVTMLDANPSFLAAARQLAARSAAPALRSARIHHGRAEDMASPLPEADLVVVAYALVELPEAVARQLVARLWTQCSGVIVLVESGSRAGFERLRRCRDELLKAGAYAVAPCPHNAPCPWSRRTGVTSRNACRGCATT